MCLILFAWQAHPAYRLILAANRDEYFDRPAQPLAYWPETPNLLAGKDLIAGGTWLGLTHAGRLAAITNFRDPASIQVNAPSRGALTYQYLIREDSPEDYLKEVRAIRSRYNGFNLILGTMDALWYYGNRAPDIQRVKPGIHGLSNHLLDTPWPKVAKGIDGLKQILSATPAIPPAEPKDLTDALFKLLADHEPAPEAALPDTGVGPHWEKFLSPVFISGPVYGTRASSVILIQNNGNAIFIEKTFQSTDIDALHSTYRRFSFKIKPCLVI